MIGKIIEYDRSSRIGLIRFQARIVPFTKGNISSTPSKGMYVTYYRNLKDLTGVKIFKKGIFRSCGLPLGFERTYYFSNALYGLRMIILRALGISIIWGLSITYESLVDVSLLDVTPADLWLGTTIQDLLSFLYILITEQLKFISAISFLTMLWMGFRHEWFYRSWFSSLSYRTKLPNEPQCLSFSSSVGRQQFLEESDANYAAREKKW